MGYREQLQRLIDKKSSEINNLAHELVEAKAYLAGLQESLRILPKTTDEGDVELEGREPREGSIVAQARDLIKQKGRPLHVSEILEGLGRTNDGRNRASVAGSIASYARRGEVFVKTKANTFGLLGVTPPKTGPSGSFGETTASEVREAPVAEEEEPLEDDDVPF